MQIDAVEQRPGDLGHIPLDLGGGAMAFFFGIRKKPARTPIRVQRDKSNSGSFIYSLRVDRREGKVKRV